MSWLDRIRGFFGRKFFAGMIPTWQEGAAQYTPHDYGNLAREGYRKNEVIYACIREIASCATEPRLRVYQRRRNGERHARPDHPLQKLIEKPNPFITQQEMVEIILISLNISGNNYQAKVRTNAGLPAQLWFLRPDRVQIIPSREEYIQGYRYEVTGVKKDFEPEDIMHMKYYDPANDYYGLSPIAVAGRVGDVDNAATDFLKRFFDQGVQIPGMLTYKAGHVTRAEKDRIRKKWRSLYGGYKKWTDIAVIDEDVAYQKIGLDMREMDFGNLRSMSEARICSVFGVPPILAGIQIGLERSTFANYREAKKSFWEETMMPVFRKIRDKFQNELAVDFGDDIEVDFDFSQVQALQEDVNEAWRRATEAFKASMITRNMALAEIGQDPVTGGDVFLQSMMLLEVPAKSGSKMFVMPTTFKQIETPPEEKAEKWAKAVDMVARSWEGVFKDKAQALFAEEKQAILKILRKEGKAAKQGVAFQDFLISAEDYFRMRRDGWEEEFLPLFKALMGAQAETIVAAFGITFDIEAVEVLRFLSEYSFKFAEGITGKSGKKVGDIIRQAQQEGWTVPQLRDALTDAFEQFEKVRAERIARTETIRSSNAGSHEAYRLAGVRKKEWYAAIDRRTCEWCLEMHQKYGPGTNGIAMEEVFWRQGSEMPVGEGDQMRVLKFDYEDIAHPPLHCACRCVLLPVIEEV